jgi:hypothetical protein
MRPERLPYKTSTEFRAIQTAKIRELQEALMSAGFWSLDQQSKVLGLPRSTSWTILRGTHKKGLSAAVIKRILSTPELPSSGQKASNRIRSGKDGWPLWPQSATTA